MTQQLMKKVNKLPKKMNDKQLSKQLNDMGLSFQQYKEVVDYYHIVKNNIPETEDIIVSLVQ